ncbi:MAG: hypothetical protein ACRDRL_01010 [Sciscionella sp.]
MPSLVEALHAREAEARALVAALTEQMAAARVALDRVVITREEVAALLGESLHADRPGGDDRSARFAAGTRSRPARGPGAAIPAASAEALKVIEASHVPLRAREVCDVLGGAGVQAMRNRLGRLAAAGLITAVEPGLYVAADGAR